MKLVNLFKSNSFRVFGHILFGTGLEFLRVLGVELSDFRLKRIVEVRRIDQRNNFLEN